MCCKRCTTSPVPRYPCSCTGRAAVARKAWRACCTNGAREGRPLRPGQRRRPARDPGRSRTLRFRTWCLHRRGTGAPASILRTGARCSSDEVAEMPLPVQAKLLRVLEERQVAALGSTQAEPVDFRLISASHADLGARVGEGHFREDLFYRLAVVVLEVPPLRERPEDLLPLAELFVRQTSRTEKRLSPEAIDRLRAYPWPGNVRELRNAMARAAILSVGSVILPEHLPPALREASLRPCEQPGPKDLATLEKCAILDALRRHAGNRTHAAQELGISRRTLLYRLKEYGFEDGEGA
ncbi:MAG: sigma 54-interacting transcriptional regulator [Planctomycetota bacterium]